MERKKSQCIYVCPFQPETGLAFWWTSFQSFIETDVLKIRYWDTRGISWKASFSLYIVIEHFSPIIKQPNKMFTADKSPPEECMFFKLSLTVQTWLVFQFWPTETDCSVGFCQTSPRAGGSPAGAEGRVTVPGTRARGASFATPSRLCDVIPKPRPRWQSQSKRGTGASRSARAGGRPCGPAQWTRSFSAPPRLRSGRSRPRGGRPWTPRRSSTIAWITTTCATSRPAGPGAARVGRGASGNCAPTGQCPAATSARSRRSSSTASASVASASCSPGRALGSSERRCVRAAAGQNPGKPREHPGHPGDSRVGPLRLHPGGVAPFRGCSALASRGWTP